MKTLFLQKRGCDFLKDDEMEVYSDCENYRLFGRIVDKFGRDLYVEFTRGIKWRTTNKRNGKPLKKPIQVHHHKLCITTQYDNTNGSYRDLELEKEIAKRNYSFKQAHILKAVNSICDKSDNYEHVVICDSLPKMFGSVARITKEDKATFFELCGGINPKALSGWREQNALEKMCAYKVIEHGRIVRIFYENAPGYPQFVDYDMKKGQFCG